MKYANDVEWFKAMPDHWYTGCRMNQLKVTDDRLRQQQRQNELKAFLDYEQRLRDAYAARQAKDA